MRIKHDLDAILRRSETFSIQYGYRDNVVQLRDPAQRPDEALEEKQCRDELLAYIGKRNAEARSYAELILSGDDQITRRHAAALMRVDVTHIDYLKRKLRAVLEEFLGERSNSDSPARRLLTK